MSEHDRPVELAFLLSLNLKCSETTGRNDGVVDVFLLVAVGGLLHVLYEGIIGVLTIDNCTALRVPAWTG